jgi:hypothetical protein
MVNKLINGVKQYPVRSLIIVCVISLLIYLISDSSVISSFIQGFKDGYAGK